jgi:hypothetical protein
MGPQPYLRSAVNQNVVMQRITVITISYKEGVNDIERQFLYSVRVWDCWMPFDKQSLPFH